MWLEYQQGHGLNNSSFASSAIGSHNNPSSKVAVITVLQTHGFGEKTAGKEN